MGVLGWKNALVAEVGALVFISISKFFSPMWNGSIPIDFHPNDNLRLVVLLQKNRCTSILDGATPHLSVAKESPNLFFFTKPRGLQVYMAPGSSFIKKNGEYFCCWKTLVIWWLNLAWKQLVFVGHVFHISNFWSCKKHSFSKENWGFSWSLKCGFPPALVLQHQGESS